MAGMELEKYMDDLAARIDPEQENANLESWMNFLTKGCPGGIFLSPSRRPAPAKVDWPKIYINDAFEDPEKMVLREFAMISNELAKGSNEFLKGNRLNVRCNYSTGILPSLFGCDMFYMDHELDTLPTAIPLHSDDAVKKLVSTGVPKIRQSMGAKVFETVGLFNEIFAKYPIIGKYVSLYHPDLQGPIDVAEVIWGSEMFYAFIDSPQLVHDFLGLVTDTYIEFLRQWYEAAPSQGEYNNHWGMMYKGDVMLRNDSLMNLSPATYIEFIRPLDQKIFDTFNGGGIHFCGRGDHFIEAMSEMRGLSHIDVSQPEYNNMETIYRNTVDKGIRLSVNAKAAQSSIDAGRDLRGMVIGRA